MRSVGITKVCTKCGIEKGLKGFRKQKNGRLGRSTECRVCLYNRKKEWKKDNLDKIRSYDREWYKNNREKVLKRCLNRYKKDPKKILVQNKKWRQENPDKVLIYRKGQIKKRNANPKIKLNHNLSSAIGKSLRKNKKGAHWEDLVGYTIEKLRKHLERQFVNGMSWENYGKWQIDHKIPIDVFNFTKPKHRDFKRCWALKNLQPLWAKENVLKSNNIATHFQPSLLM